MCSETRMIAIPEWADAAFDETHPEFGRTDDGTPAFAIDACIADALLAVWTAGYRTLGCCCGHGQEAGGIITLDTAGAGQGEPVTQTQRRWAEIHTEAMS